MKKGLRNILSKLKVNYLKLKLSNVRIVSKKLAKIIPDIEL